MSLDNLTSSKHDFEMKYINDFSTFPIHKGILIKSDNVDEYVYNMNMSIIYIYIYIYKVYCN